MFGGGGGGKNGPQWLGRNVFKQGESRTCCLSLANVWDYAYLMYMFPPGDEIQYHRCYQTPERNPIQMRTSTKIKIPCALYALCSKKLVFTPLFTCNIQRQETVILLSPITGCPRSLVHFHAYTIEIGQDYFSLFFGCVTSSFPFCRSNIFLLFDEKNLKFV